MLAGFLAKSREIQKQLQQQQQHAEIHTEHTEQHIEQHIEQPIEQQEETTVVAEETKCVNNHAPAQKNPAGPVDVMYNSAGVDLIVFSDKASIVQWDEAAKATKIVIERGKASQLFFNISEGSNTKYLALEESIFQVERGAAALFIGDRVASIQEAYSLLTSAGSCFDNYMVYSHLRLLGYVVRKPSDVHWFEEKHKLVTFLVWRPDCKGKKPPQFRVCVQRSTASFPEMEELLSMRYQDDSDDDDEYNSIPIKFFVVDGGTVVSFGVDFPMDIKP